MTSRFLQLHFLTAYAANNLNRDDLNRPKSLLFGSAPRLRLSSQAVKRAWRISDVLQAAMHETGGSRSRDAWYQIGQELVAAGYAENDVVAHLTPLRTVFEGKKKEEAVAADQAGIPEAAQEAAQEGTPAAPAKKGKGKKEKSVVTGLLSLKGDLYFFSHAELAFIRATAEASLKAGKVAVEKELKAQLSNLPMSGDVAMFGRMVAADNSMSIEGAVQVAHPFTVNKMVVDDDFFTAVDDLGDFSGHLGSNGFGSGLYYGYVNVDVPLLLRNLGGDKEQARDLLLALAEAVATVAPGGKQNSFAARAYATFLMAEAGNAQPRSFADAFLSPVRAEPLAETAVQALLTARDSLQKAFPSQATQVASLNRLTQEGSFSDIAALVNEVLG